MNIRSSAAVLFSLTLAACGGGGGSGNPTGETPATPSSPSNPSHPSSNTPNVTPPTVEPAPVPAAVPGGDMPAAGSNVVGAWSGNIVSWTDGTIDPQTGIRRQVFPLHAALLPDGRLMTFGMHTYLGPNQRKFDFDIWTPPQSPTGAQADAIVGLSGASDPARHLILPTGVPTHLFCSAQILVPTTGELIIAGGDVWRDADGAASNLGTNEANVFRPTANNMIPNPGGNMSGARWYGSPTTLPNGEMLIQGGTDGAAVYGGGVPINTTTVEIRNPVTGQFRTLANIDTTPLQNNYPRNWIAPDGKIFGWDHQKLYRLDWTGQGALTMLGDTGIPWHNGWATTSTSVMYRPGKILQVGGVEADFKNDPGARDGLDTQIIDINAMVPGSPVTTEPTITYGPRINLKRQWANSTVLPDGKVVLMGGSERNVLDDQSDWSKRGSDALNVEIFDPDANGGQGAWTLGPAQQRFRLYHSIALLMPNGTVVSAAGGWPGPQTFYDAEVYYPPYLFNADGSYATRPRLASVRQADRAFVAGGVNQSVAPTAMLELTSPDAANVSRITIIKTGSVTHSVNFEQRFIEVGNAAAGTIARTGDQLQVKLPANPHETPPGYYMAFILDVNGVPSEAQIFRIEPSQ